MEKKDRFIGLDIIRITAILGVVLVHLTIYIPTGAFHTYLVYGKYGVQLFFVLSGFLCASSYRTDIGAFAYWKRRAVRILPAYYVSIFCGLLAHIFLLKDVTSDLFRLGWLRYFFGLNTLLPSTKYSLWNNMYGLWSMSCFIGLYVMAPLIFKYVHSLKRSIIFFFVSFGIGAVWERLLILLFASYNNIESLGMLIASSPFGKLHQFCLGITAFFYLKEGEAFEGVVFFALCAFAGEILGLPEMVWCALSSILIIAAIYESKKITHHVSKAETPISFLSEKSYHVYLSHFIAFDITGYIIMKAIPVLEKTNPWYSLFMVN